MIGRSGSTDLSLSEFEGNLSMAINGLNQNKSFANRTPTASSLFNGYNPTASSPEEQQQQQIQTLPNFNFNSLNGSAITASALNSNNTSLDKKNLSTSATSPSTAKQSTNGLLSSSDLSSAAAAACGLTNSALQNWLSMSAQLSGSTTSLTNALNSGAYTSPGSSSNTTANNPQTTMNSPDFSSAPINQLASPLTTNGFPSSLPNAMASGNPSAAALNLAAMHNNPYIYKYIIHPRYLLDFIVNKKNEI